MEHEPDTRQPSDDLWALRHEVLNRTFITYRYHRKRQKFFDLCDKLTKVATVVMGFSLLGNVARAHIPLLASLIGCFGLLSLIFNYSDCRQRHKELAEKAAQLISDIEGLPWPKVKDVTVAAWREQAISIDKLEPPNLKQLVLICEMEQTLAEGHAWPHKKLRLPQRFAAYFFSW